MIAASPVEGFYRRLLLILPVLIFAGTLVELWFEDHYQEAIQYIPFGLCIAGLVVTLAALRRPSRGILQALRVVMVVIALGSLLGAALHLRANFMFELEIRPNATIGDVVMEALKGNTPLVAPGVLMIGAVLAFASTYKHPALTAKP